jgi:hypothetical protein
MVDTVVVDRRLQQMRILLEPACPSARRRSFPIAFIDTK